MANFINASINESPVISATAGAVIEDGAHKAVKFDASGNAVLAGDGDVPMGILIGSTEAKVSVDDDLAIQIKDVGYIVVGGDIVRGDPVTVAANGVGVKADSGKFILGFALNSAASGGHLQIQITKSGYMS